MYQGMPYHNTPHASFDGLLRRCKTLIRQDLRRIYKIERTTDLCTDIRIMIVLISSNIVIWTLNCESSMIARLVDWP